MTSPEPNIDDLLAELEGVWLESLTHQVYDLHHRRQLHDEFMDLLDAQDHRSASWAEKPGTDYRASAIGLRSSASRRISGGAGVSGPRRWEILLNRSRPGGGSELSRKPL